MPGIVYVQLYVSRIYTGNSGELVYVESHLGIGGVLEQYDVVLRHTYYLYCVFLERIRVVDGVFHVRFV